MRDESRMIYREGRYYADWCAKRAHCQATLEQITEQVRGRVFSPENSAAMLRLGTAHLAEELSAVIVRRFMRKLRVYRGLMASVRL